MDWSLLVLTALAFIGMAAVVVGVILLQTNDGSIERIRILDPVPAVPGANPSHRPLTSRELSKPNTDVAYADQVRKQLADTKVDPVARKDRILSFMNKTRHEG